MKNRKTDLGVSEILGAVLLLGIAVCIFAVFSYSILSTPPPKKAPIVEISGTFFENQVVLTHRWGESLPLNTKVSLSYGGIKKSFIVGDYMDNESKSNGFWDLGEKVYYPVPDNFNYKTSPDVNISLVDYTNSNIVFVGKVNYTPTCDMSIGLKVNNSSPRENEKVTFTITVFNNCDINASGTVVEFILPKGLTYYSSSATQGFYNSSIGDWDVGVIAPRQNASITINAIVGRISYPSVPTELVLILDGSSSITSSSWQLMRQGVSSAIKDGGYFPHDGTSELTVVQFGGSSPPHATLEVSPTIVTDSNVNTIANFILNMAQIKGYTPTASGIHLAADTLIKSSMFDPSIKQVFLLVTDGLANCEWISGTYNGTYYGDGWSRYSNQKHSGTYSVGTTYGATGDLISNDLNTTGASSITVDFWYRLQNTQSSDLQLYFYNGNSYDNIISLGGNTKNTWLHYTNIITDPKYFISNFRIRLSSQPGFNAYVWLDDVLIQTDKILISDGFENSNWNVNWENSGQKSTEDAISYLVNTTKLTINKDEFDALAVQFDSGATPWLKNKVVWPQPGYYAPPFVVSPHLGWVRNVSTWQDFSNSLNQSFGYVFNGKVPINASIKALSFTDPKIANNKISISISVVPTYS